MSTAAVVITSRRSSTPCFLFMFLFILVIVCFSGLSQQQAQQQQGRRRIQQQQQQRGGGRHYQQHQQLHHQRRQRQQQQLQLRQLRQEEEEDQVAQHQPKTTTKAEQEITVTAPFTETSAATTTTTTTTTTTADNNNNVTDIDATAVADTDTILATLEMKLQQGAWLLSMITNAQQQQQQQSQNSNTDTTRINDVNKMIYESSKQANTLFEEILDLLYDHTGSNSSSNKSSSSSSSSSSRIQDWCDHHRHMVLFYNGVALSALMPSLIFESKNHKKQVLFDRRTNELYKYNGLKAFHCFKAAMMIVQTNDRIRSIMLQQQQQQQQSSEQDNNNNNNNSMHPKQFIQHTRQRVMMMAKQYYVEASNIIGILHKQQKELESLDQCGMRIYDTDNEHNTSHPQSPQRHTIPVHNSISMIQFVYEASQLAVNMGKYDELDIFLKYLSTMQPNYCGLKLLRGQLLLHNDHNDNDNDNDNANDDGSSIKNDNNNKMKALQLFRDATSVTIPIPIPTPIPTLSPLTPTKIVQQVQEQQQQLQVLPVWELSSAWTTIVGLECDAGIVSQEQENKDDNGNDNNESSTTSSCLRSYKKLFDGIVSIRPKFLIDYDAAQIALINAINLMFSEIVPIYPDLYEIGLKAVQHNLANEPLQLPKKLIKNVSFMPYRTDAYTWNSVRYLEQNYHTIRDEVLEKYRTGEIEVAAQKETAGLHVAGNWKELDIITRGKVRHQALDVLPLTSKIVMSLGDGNSMVYGGSKISLMKAGTVVKPHTGTTNARLRIHLGIKIPTNLVYIRVNNITTTWTEGKCIVIDDSYVHEVWHNGNSTSTNSTTSITTEENDDTTTTTTNIDIINDRLVLIVDVWHVDMDDETRLDSLVEDANDTNSQQFLEMYRNHKNSPILALKMQGVPKHLLPDGFVYG